MNSMVVAGLEPGLRSGSQEACQWVAVQSLRRLARPRGVEAGGVEAGGVEAEGGRAVLPHSAETAWAEAAFQAFLAAAQQAPGVRTPRFGELGQADQTKDERRLLRALAAAQAGDWPVVDNHLYKFALDRRERAGLADAVCALAAALAASGFVLPALPLPSIPAPALRVAFMHGLGLDEIDVAWPGAPAG